MTVFGRISQLITPPPTKSKTPLSSPPSWGDRQPVNAAEMKNILSRYFREEPFDAACQARLRESLAGLARTCGVYLTASEFLKALDAYPKREAAGFEERKACACEMAGDLFLEHLREELRATATGERPLGPNVFDDYCREIIDPYLRSTRPLRAIEAIVPVAEEMVMRGIFAPPRRETYLALAVQAAQTLLLLAIEKQERDLRSTHMKLRLEKKGATPPPAPARTKVAITNDVMAYLRELKSAMEGLRDALARVGADPLMTAEQLASVNDLELVRKQGQLLQGVCEAIKECKHLPIHARLTVYVAHLRDRIQPGAGKELIRRAVALLGSTHAVEQRIGFQGLATARMREAQELAASIRDESPRS